MTKTTTVAKALVGVLDEISSLSCADSTPSFFKIPFIWADIDPEQRNSFILSDAVGRNDDKRPRYRVTVTEIGK